VSETSLTAVVLIIALGLAFVGFGGYLFVDQNRTVANNEPVEATVVSSEVVRTYSGSSDEPARYRPSITYEYAVGGETYRSSNVFPGEGAVQKSDRDWAQDVVEDHPEGEQVTASYDPENPSEAFLVEQRQLFGPLVFGGMGLLTFLVGVGNILKRFTSVFDRPLAAPPPIRRPQSLSATPGSGKDCVSGVGRG